MKKFIIYLFFILFTLSSCENTKSVLSRTKYTARKSSPTGKYRNPTMFNSVNPFQGRAKAKLSKSKKKKIKLFKKKKRKEGTYRKGKKPGRNFSTKRSTSKKRLKSSGNRTKSASGKGRRNKNLFKTRKK